MRVWLDTEFIDKEWEMSANTDLISIGLVREDGKELYLENAGVSRHKMNADPWLSKHVTPKLSDDPKVRLWVPEIAEELKSFCSDIRPHFWAYYASYDFFLLCKIFGGLMNFPKGWTRYCGDTKQYIMHLGLGDELPDAPAQDPKTKHHALEDAKWLKELHLWYESRWTMKSLARRPDD